MQSAEQVQCTEGKIEAFGKQGLHAALIDIATHFKTYEEELVALRAAVLGLLTEGADDLKWQRWHYAEKKHGHESDSEAESAVFGPYRCY